MRIAIVNPPSDEGTTYIREGRCMQSQASWTALFPPLTLMYLSALLKEQKHQVLLADCMANGESIQEIMPRLRSFAPQLTVVNTAFPSIRSDLAFAEFCHNLLGCRTAVLGIFPTLLTKECFQLSASLDYAVVGEAETCLPDLLQNQGEIWDDEPHVPGLAWRDRWGQVHLPDRPARLADLDGLPLPDRDSLDNSLYKFPLNGQPLAMICTSRGCPGNCTFCLAPLYYGRRPRARSASSIVAEMQICQEKYGINHFILWGETIAPGTKGTLELCQSIMDSRLKVLWMGALRADSVTQEMAALLKESGCHMVTLGMESAVQSLLDGVRKGLKVEDSVRASNYLRQAGVKVMGHFIVGLPGETQETAAQTRAFARQYCDYSQFYCACPYPGTQLYKQALEAGWLQQEDWQDFTLTTSLMNQPQLSAQEVRRLRTRAFLSFYLRPAPIWDNLRQIRPASLLNILNFRKWFT